MRKNKCRVCQISIPDNQVYCDAECQKIARDMNNPDHPLSLVMWEDTPEDAMTRLCKAGTWDTEGVAGA